MKISDIIAALNNGIAQVLEHEHPEGLAIILTFAQSAFEQMHSTVGYTYASWFEASIPLFLRFLDSNVLISLLL